MSEWLQLLGIAFGLALVGCVPLATYCAFQPRRGLLYKVLLGSLAAAGLLALPVIVQASDGGEPSLYVAAMGVVAIAGVSGAHVGVAVTQVAVSPSDLRARRGRGALAGLAVAVPLLVLEAPSGMLSGRGPVLEVLIIAFLPTIVLCIAIGVFIGAPGLDVRRSARRPHTTFWPLLVTGAMGATALVGAGKCMHHHATIASRRAGTGVRRAAEPRTDGHVVVQELVGRAFGGDPQAVGALVGYLGDSDPLVRRAAAEAIGTVSGVRSQRPRITTEVVEALGKAARGRKSEVRLSAVQSLGRLAGGGALGPGAIRAIGPQLAKAGSDRDQQVRAEAREQYRQWWYLTGQYIGADPPR